MKRVQRVMKSLPAFSFLLVMIVLAGFTVSCDDDDDNVTDNRPYTVSGSANGAQMVPAVTSSGTATITGTYNPATRELNYTSNWADLTSAPTSGGFYAGASGVTGVAVGTPFTIASGATGTGTTTGTMTLTEEQEKAFLAGGWYYSYGTVDNPNGEVRGQISASR
jgi:hypothetical protein